MARKTSKVTDSDKVEETTLNLVPENSEEIQAAVDVKVSKADMVNILVQQVRDALEAERNAVIVKQKTAQAKIKSIEERAEKLHLKSLPDYKKISHARAQRHHSWNDSVSTIVVNYYYSYNGNTTKLEDGTSIHTDFSGVTASVTIPNNHPLTKEWIEADLELHNISMELNEVMDRIKKASSTAYIKAQLDKGIIAKSASGKQLVQNLNAMGKAMVETIFAKKDEKLLTQ